MNVTLEVLAASGLFGFVFFVVYLGIVLHACFLAKREDPLHGQLMGALGLGFLLLYLVLQFNQGILRIYLWNHLAVIAVLASVLPRRGSFT